MELSILDVTLRVVHIVSAILVSGGLSLIPLAVRPALHMLDDAHRDTVLTLIERRLRRFIWIGVLGLLVSGIVNWVSFAGIYKAMGPIGNALIGTKFLLAIITFALIWVRQARMLGPKADRPLLMVIVHLIALVIVLASVLRHLRLEHLTSSGT